MGRKLVGGLRPLCWGGKTGSPSNTKSISFVHRTTQVAGQVGPGIRIPWGAKDDRCKSCKSEDKILPQPKSPHRYTGNHVPYVITQRSPGRGDIPALTPAEAGTRFTDPGGMQGWLDLWLYVPWCYTRPNTVTHPSKLLCWKPRINWLRNSGDINVCKLRKTYAEKYSNTGGLVSFGWLTCGWRAWRHAISRSRETDSR